MSKHKPDTFARWGELSRWLFKHPSFSAVPTSLEGKGYPFGDTEQWLTNADAFFLPVAPDWGNRVYAAGIWRAACPNPLTDRNYHDDANYLHCVVADCEAAGEDEDGVGLYRSVYVWDGCVTHRSGTVQRRLYRHGVFMAGVMHVAQAADAARASALHYTAKKFLGE